MKNINKFFKANLIFVISLGISACKDDENGNPAPPLSAKITLQNAQLIVNEVKSGETYSNIAFSDPGTIIRSTTADLPLNQDITINIKNLSKKLIRQAEDTGMVSISRQTGTGQVHNCSGGGTLTVSIAGNSITLAYNNCIEDITEYDNGNITYRSTMNGRIIATINSSGDTQYYYNDYNVQGIITFDNFAVSAVISEVLYTSKINGSLEGIETKAGDKITLIDRSPSLVVMTGNSQYGVYNMELLAVVEPASAPSVMTVNIKGTFQTKYGVYNVNTNDLMTYNSVTGTAKGEIVITGLNSSLTIKVIDFNNTALYVDENGDGTTDSVSYVSTSSIFY